MMLKFHSKIFKKIQQLLLRNLLQNVGEDMKDILLKKLVIFLIFLLLIGCNVVPAEPQISSNEDDSDFDESILSLMKSGHMPSISMGIVKNNSLAWSKSYGYSNRLRKEKATNTTIYLAGSISKTVTGVALMQLYEQGLFDLDDDVNDYLPFSLRNPNYPDVNITFRMLLAHQSSLSGSNTARTFIFFSYLNHKKSHLEEFFVPGGAYYTPKIWGNVAPGESRLYSDHGFELLGYLVELISNETYEDYCKKNIFEPLDMKDTSFRIKELDEKKLVTPYLYFMRIYIPLPNYEIIGANAAAGGLRTNIVDLSKYLIMHINGGKYNGVRILNEDSVDLMHKVQYPDNNGRFGLGWQVWSTDESGENRLEGHTGEVPGGASFMYYHEYEKTGVIIFVNQFTTKLRIMEIFSCLSASQILFEKAREL